MLQPLQLKDVTARYPNEIAELRDFLAKSGAPLDTDFMLHAIAARLNLDRAFRRDLTLHLGAVIHTRKHQATHSDLLGMLALAAAGPYFASQAHDDDAHDLLRFVIDVRRSLDSTPEEPHAESQAQLPVDRAPIMQPPPSSAPSRDQTLQDLLHRLTPAPPAQTGTFEAPLHDLPPHEVEEHHIQQELDPPPPPPFAVEPRLYETTSYEQVEASAQHQPEPPPAPLPPPPVPLQPAPTLRRPMFETTSYEQQEQHLSLRPMPSAPVSYSEPASSHQDEDEREYEAYSYDDEEPQNTGKKKRILWTILAACLLAAISAGLWWRQKANAVDTSAPITQATVETKSTPPPAVVPAEPANPTPLPQPEPAPQASAIAVPVRSRTAAKSKPRQPETRAKSKATPKAEPATPARPATGATPQPASTASGPATAPAPAASAPANAATASTPLVPRSTSGPRTPGAPVPIVIPRTNSGAASGAAVPAAAIGQRLGSVTIPNAQDSASDVGPRLQRRQAATTPPEATPINLGTRGSANPTRGVVHSTSLGIMAAFLVYSPAPAYPAAASAAHIQGEVKVEADVDRDGNVASARVISGPPQLREAALQAVQHWRYRPVTAAGRPATAAATVILDFQLP